MLTWKPLVIRWNKYISSGPCGQGKVFHHLYNTKTAIQATLATLHRPQLRHFEHYDPFMTDTMATTTAAKVPDTAVIPPTPGNETQNPISPPSSHSPTQSTQDRRQSATEVINAVLAEDEAKNRQNRDAPPTKSRTSSRSRSRSRPTSAAGSRRGSTSVWDNDPEKKQRKIVEKIFGHHWTPDFLK
ncbi:hypothetical protein AC578_6540 [Pseudocercospora eumusae]|uniref:Uncharacterized protein n=1 Tax=Pseudocercospora eumusae TaxID=321146 RepID=A0A139HHY3_9PEZI|nr:hypothetical protein AC578_6540 [Pseudocercospora eumusae]